MPSTCLVRSMASLSFALPGLERCERLRSASLRACGVHPGRLAQGPEEKKGRAGRTAGAFAVIADHSFQNEAPRWGGVARRRYTDSQVKGQLTPARAIDAYQGQGNAPAEQSFLFHHRKGKRHAACHTGKLG